ncbi:membrane protein [Intrasporangium oryzae NRRL B-24470]|uniref:Membrane protein n=1 Tax=Intrasporangium oryzae NRRL B-24470 TaxID=1386089 RepID=W9GA18_9MICO|nr:glutaredoxin domain-containing protein [Intrasporangium oryzae]EWT02067.1 membrane protein [Intrasporangium oryzae NRRL B-24470]
MGIAEHFVAIPSPTPHAEAQAHGATGVAVYWRPNCPFTMRLRAKVRRHSEQIAWVNIWEDADGAAWVRSVNDGNETVPTVLISGVAHTNPDPALVVAALAR